MNAPRRFRDVLMMEKPPRWRFMLHALFIFQQPVIEWQARRDVLRDLAIELDKEPYGTKTVAYLQEIAGKAWPRLLAELHELRPRPELPLSRG